MPADTTASSSPFTFPHAGHLMVLETPLLRVSRPVAACSRCRAAKVKCDGKLPACTACEKSNKAAECSSTNDQFARGKERSYVATLETRVEKLERRIAEARARRKSSTTGMTDFDDAFTSPKLSTDLPGRNKTTSARAARRKEASDIDNLVSDFGLLAVNATARDFHGFTTPMSYARLILSTCTKEPLPNTTPQDLPPRYAATPLIQHYLNNVFVLLPVFEEASFWSSVDAVYNPEVRKPLPFDYWTVRMVLALSSISLSQQRGDAQYFDAVGHVTAALEFAEDVLHPGFVATIQALVLLVEFAMMDPHHFDSWHLIGAASRAMVDIGMHQDPLKALHSGKSKLELRRRVYWCVFALDRSTSLVQTRAFSFSDDSATVAHPFAASISSPSTKTQKTQFWLQNFDTAAQFFKIRQLQSEWYTKLFQSGREPWPDAYGYIWKTYRQMTDWYNNISKNTLPNTQAFFELEVLYSYVYVLSPSPRCPAISNYAQRLIFEHCIAYAINLRAIMRDKSSPTTKIPLTFYDAMRAYMTGRQFVDVLQRNLDQQQHPQHTHSYPAYSQHHLPPTLSPAPYSWANSGAGGGGSGSGGSGAGGAGAAGGGGGGSGGVGSATMPAPQYQYPIPSPNSNSHWDSSPGAELRPQFPGPMG
ncbi:hypothetical protein EJ05DRAFT_533005 [Pseudovirgaria hyperparasitica]|uniref:Zn(2)-C6 fungal-type domain-containing protein n=1 Tax=Pseudovirgaria hyperparasitica TaxID=470096 RepID=A0A6A6VXE9_9PEZI|nr:uncharacterized protein EJ05DRAFT_533005 [Pseudovirgaria hyperparasitica]KAF2755282.1 hypothetical protein EJ05DRAFT_533005 [Pseudovirgaria hyperparasitica]